MEPYIEILITVLRALLPIVVTLIAVKMVVGLIIDRLTRRVGVSAATASFWKTSILVLALLIATIISLTEIGVKIELFYILVGLITLSIVLGSVDIVANSLAGYALMTLKPFKRGDTVTLRNITGTIREVGTLHTQILCENGILYVPNREFLKEAVLNRQYTSPTRITVTFKVKPSESLSKVEGLMIEAATKCRELTIPPEPEAFVKYVGGNYSEVQLIAYITNPKRGPHVSSELMKMVKEEFEKEGVALY